MDIEDKWVAKCDTLGGTKEMIVINESGLYSSILRSKLPNAINLGKIYIFYYSQNCLYILY